MNLISGLIKVFTEPMDNNLESKMHEVNLSIIGGGATSVSFLRAFIDLISYTNAKNSRDIVTLFESSATVGHGLAYQKDMANLIINRPLQTMSAHHHDLNEFEAWLQNHSTFSGHEIVESDNASDKRAYISREIFGHYLQDLFNKTQQLAYYKNIEVNTVHATVEKISGKSPFVIQTTKDELFYADYVIVCTGHNAPVDLYQLSATPRYTNNPYPVTAAIANIASNAHVGIIGNSLTAIDVAISLKKNGHTGKISMLTRSNTPMRVRGKMVPYPLQYLTQSNIIAIKKYKGMFTLKDALKLLRKELKAHRVCWKSLFKSNPTNQSFFDILKHELIESTHERKWQAILASTNQVIELLWKMLDLKSKHLFMNRFYKIWLNVRTPIPTTNARHLINMHKRGQLDHHHSITDIVYDPVSDQYVASIGEHTTLTLDYVINATGPAKFIGKADTLAYNLIQEGYARTNPFGGVDVDFDSSAVIDSNNLINKHLRLLGHNTNGVYYFTSSLEMISKRAKHVAKNLIEFILEKKRHGKNTPPTAVPPYRTRDTAKIVN